MKIGVKKIKAIKEDLNNQSLSYNGIAKKHNVEESHVEAIDNDDDPNDIEDEETNTCSFCGEECEDVFCSSTCKIAEFND